MGKSVEGVRKFFLSILIIAVAAFVQLNANQANVLIAIAASFAGANAIEWMARKERDDGVSGHPILRGGTDHPDPSILGPAPKAGPEAEREESERCPLCGKAEDQPGCSCTGEVD